MGAFSDFASVWLIVLVCFERLVLLYGSARSMTTSKAKYHVTTVLIVAFVFNSWIFITAEPGENGCDINLEYVNLYTFMGLVEAILMIIPTIIIVVSNVLVVIRLQTHLRRMPTSPTVSFSTAYLVLNNNQSTAPMTAKSETVIKSGFSRLNSQISISSASKRKKRKNLRYADVQLTRSLLAITSVFVALNLPTHTFQYPIVDCLSYGSVLLLYTHHAILFYLYIFWSPQMKRRLLPTALKLLECYCFKFPGDY
uniref:G_PROTEIN_RECEP_F1_2 domain-containing protein n=1 Tax=Syphacia muris TaxID=451379 RepID=A0A0N5AK08_9BILA